MEKEINTEAMDQAILVYYMRSLLKTYPSTVLGISGGGAQEFIPLTNSSCNPYAH